MIGEEAMQIRSEPYVAGPSLFAPLPHALATAEPDPEVFAAFAARVARTIGEWLPGPEVTARIVGFDIPADGGLATALPLPLAARVVAIRLGGAADDADECGGLAVQRMRDRLAAGLDAALAGDWPCPVAGVAIDVTTGAASHALWLAAPAPALPPGPRPTLAAAMLDQPFRMPLAVASEMVELARLLPFVEGAIWPIAPQPLVALRTGGWRIATVRIEPTPDGRQQAVVVSKHAGQGGDA